MDHAGHLRVDFTTSEPALVGDGPETTVLRFSGAFELDPGILPQLVEAFESLAADLAA
jgi:hypothetical protein